MGTAFYDVNGLFNGGHEIQVFFAGTALRGLYISHEQKAMGNSMMIPRLD